MYLRKAIGVLYQEDQLDIEVIARGVTEMSFLGNLSLTGISQKDPVILKSEVEEFFAKLKLKPENIVVGLSPDQIAFRHLTLPAEAEDNLEQVIRLQVMNYVPTDPEEFSIEKVVQRGAEGKTFEVDLYIVPREKIKRIIDLLRSIGLPPAAVTLTSFGFERMIALAKLDAAHPIFLADLDLNNFAVYVFQAGKFSYFKLAWINPANKDMPHVLKEVERCASLVRLAEDATIDIYVNVSDANWEEKLLDESYAYIRYAKEFSPFPERITPNLKPMAVALQALGLKRKSFNLIPTEWRERSSTVSLIPTFVLAAGLIILLGLSFTRVYFQENSYLKMLDRNIQKIGKEYRSVQSLRRNISSTRRELETYQGVLQKPLSDLVILRELTEKAGEKTYLSEYVRGDNLVISGYTDSVLDLQTGLSAIRFFKSLNLQGSITKTKEGAEHFRFEIQLEEQK
jgi:Tfp pilus assembly protein PilN